MRINHSRSRVVSRGLHSFNSQLSLSTLYWIGGGRKRVV